MQWTSGVAYVTGLDFFDEVVRANASENCNRPSPCAGWTALDVLGHVGMAVEFGTRLLQGEQPTWKPLELPGNAVLGDPGQWWTTKVGSARDTVHGLDLATEVDSPMGRRSIGQGLSFPAVDLFIHGWDLAWSFGRTVEIPDEAIAFAHQVLDQIPTQQLRSPQIFGAEINPPAEATTTQRFIAWTGRNPLH
ncbi:MAG: TIGR03086 family protein [Actinomycetota bacterium]|nr:MAG: TIGR03086 family protein [Actinomycetota bacterium]